MKPSPASNPAVSTAAFWVAKNGGGKRSEQWFLKFWSIHRLVFSPRTYTGRFHFSSSRASGSASRLSSLSASRCGRWTSLSCAKKSSTLDRLGIGMVSAYRCKSRCCATDSTRSVSRRTPRGDQSADVLECLFHRLDSAIHHRVEVV